MPTKNSNFENAYERGGALVDMSFEPIQAEIFSSENVVVLIHGFTANCQYLRTFADYLESNGLRCIFFNYNSFDGIELAGETLLELLEFYNSRNNFEGRPISIVAHSMGGLVARWAIKKSNKPNGKKFFKQLIMLGTPNDGTLSDKRVIKYFISAGEFISGTLMPKTRKLFSLSMRELTKEDSQSLIHWINKDWKNLHYCPKVRTVSGGKPYIDFCKNQLVNRCVNYKIQKLFNDEPNDGLVTEESVKFYHAVANSPSGELEHFSNYAEYKAINHSNIINNASIALKVSKWLMDTP